MKQIRLVQRLKEPIGQSNPFSFGGGLVNGGFSEEAMEMLKNIFSFDYMGAAEFEFGGVPTAFQSLAMLAIDDKLSSTWIPIDGKKVWIIAPTKELSEISAWIVSHSGADFYGDMKESLGLKSSLEGSDNVKGWLKIEKDRDCEEPFMFFIDEDMFDKMVKLLQLDK